MTPQERADKIDVFVTLADNKLDRFSDRLDRLEEAEGKQLKRVSELSDRLQDLADSVSRDRPTPIIVGAGDHERINELIRMVNLQDGGFNALHDVVANISRTVELMQSRLTEVTQELEDLAVRSSDEFSAMGKLLEGICKRVDGDRLAFRTAEDRLADRQAEMRLDIGALFERVAAIERGDDTAFQSVPPIRIASKSEALIESLAGENNKLREIIHNQNANYEKSNQTIVRLRAILAEHDKQQAQND